MAFPLLIDSREKVCYVLVVQVLFAVFGSGMLASLGRFGVFICVLALCVDGITGSYAERGSEMRANPWRKHELYCMLSLSLTIAVIGDRALGTPMSLLGAIGAVACVHALQQL